MGTLSDLSLSLSFSISLLSSLSLISLTLLIPLFWLFQRLLLVDPEKFGTDALRQHRALEREFRFDAVVGTSAGEDEVQALLGAEGLVDQLVRNGHNGTVLAYGPTGKSDQKGKNDRNLTGSDQRLIGSELVEMSNLMYNQKGPAKPTPWSALGKGRG